MEMDVKTVSWANRFRSEGVSAKTARKEIERIKKRCGGSVTQDAILEEAAKPRNPLHRLFDWDDSVAADKWRRSQVTTMMRSLQVVYKESVDPVPNRIYEIVEHSAPKKPGSKVVFASAKDAMADSGVRDRQIRECVAALMALRRRFKHLQEFDRLFGEIESVVSGIAED